MHLVVAPPLSPQICKPNQVWILKILVSINQFEEKKLKHFRKVFGDFIFPEQGGDFIAEGRAVSLDALLALLQTQAQDFSSFCSQSCQETLWDTSCGHSNWINDLKLQTHCNPSQTLTPAKIKFKLLPQSRNLTTKLFFLCYKQIKFSAFRTH